MTIDQIAAWNRKMLTDMDSEPPMVDVHERERQAHERLKYVLECNDHLMLYIATAGIVK